MLYVVLDIYFMLYVVLDIYFNINAILRTTEKKSQNITEKKCKIKLTSSLNHWN